MAVMTQYYAEKLKQGLHYQDFVVEELYNIGLPIISYASKEYQNMIGENKCGFEIKFDSKWQETGNLYIETAEKSNPNNFKFIPSGIYRNDNTWLYIIGDYIKIFIFGKKHLILMHKKRYYNNKEISTSQGFLLPIDEADKYALRVINK